MKLIKCEGCEKKIKVYFGRRRRFCSRKCLVMIQKRMSHCIRTCLGCGKMMSVHKSKVAVGRGKYCSFACRKTRIFKKCEYCGIYFKSRALQMGKFCSKLCFVNHKKNKIIIYKNIAKIRLLNVKEEIVGYAIIDSNLVEKVRKFTWHKDSLGYAANKDSLGYAAMQVGKRGKRIRLHSFLLAHDGFLEIDHINGNKLDCRLKNLRSVTHQQNMQNVKTHKDNKLGVEGKGVRELIRKNGNSFQVRIKNNGVNIHVGTFYSLSEAILARKLAEKKYFGMVVRR